MSFPLFPIIFQGLNSEALLLGMGHVKLRWRGDTGKPSEETSLATTSSNMTAVMVFAFKMGQQQCLSLSNASASSGPSRKPILALEDKKPSTEELEATHRPNLFSLCLLHKFPDSNQGRCGIVSEGSDN